ncbi:ABC transporter ATP-binding protein, partial [Kibdelosporangium lantanae]
MSVKLQVRSRRLLGSLARPHLWSCVLALVIVIAQNAASMAGPLLIAIAIDDGIPNALNGNTSTLAWCVGAYFVSACANSFLLASFQRLSTRIGQDILLDLRQRIFRHVQRLSLSFHESYTSGKIISRLTADLDTINELLDDGLNKLLNAVLSLAGIGTLLLVLDLPLGLLVLAGFVPLVLITRWFQATSKRAYRFTRSAIAKVIVQFVETMNGMRAVQAFRREPRNQAIMDSLSGSYRDANVKAYEAIATYTASVRAVGNLSLAVVLGIGAWRVTGGGLELGVLTAFTLYLRRFYDPLDDLAMVTNSYSSASAALEKISGVLEEAPSVPEPLEPKPLPPGGRIVFDHVEFHYGPDTPVVLPEFSLTIPAGQTVALVGATGAGKSTVAKLVARFYDPSRGSVQLSGVDLRDVADEDLRAHVVMVTQENFLFAGSVADNIALGRPTAT